MIANATYFYSYIEGKQLRVYDKEADSATNHNITQVVQTSMYILKRTISKTQKNWKEKLEKLPARQERWKQR